MSQTLELSRVWHNGLGDRLKETVNDLTIPFAMDLNAGLPQTLSDGKGHDRKKFVLYLIGR